MEYGNTDEAAAVTQTAQRADFWIERFKELTRTRDIISLHTLAKVYREPPRPYVLNGLVKEMRLITRSKTTVYYKCKKLHAMGLIELLRGSPCLIYPKDEIPANSIWTLLNAVDKRLGIGNE